MPASATATYQWMKCSTPDGTFTNIVGADEDSYTLLSSDYGFYFRVEATGSGDYSGAATSPYRGPIEPASISIPAIGGIASPILNATAVTAITETVEYTGTIAWSPTLSAGKFLGNTVYTATITLQPKFGYTTAGVAEDFYTILGATTVDHVAGSGIITATFPSTSLTPITAIETIEGTPMVDQTLYAGALTPAAATATYQWQRSLNGTDWTNIEGATSSSFNLTAGDYTYYIRVAAIGTGEYSAVVSSAAVGPIVAAPINISMIEGIPVPVWLGQPETTISATSQFTGTVTWSPSVSFFGFSRNKAYTATITLSPKSGYTLNGVPANFFVVVGASTQTNPANSGVITASYPKTKAGSLDSIDGIKGTPMVGQVLTAGVVYDEYSDPVSTVNYQWWQCDTPDGLYDAILGATSSTYTLTASDYNSYIMVSASGTGDYIGEVMSPYKGPIQPAVISIYTIPGVTPPVTGEVPVTSLTDTVEYTLDIEWSPTVFGTFEADVIYTATITVAPKNGYTLDGVPEDFFQIAGTNFIANAAGDGVVTAEFPETEPEMGDLSIDFFQPYNVLSIEKEAPLLPEIPLAPLLIEDTETEPVPADDTTLEPTPTEDTTVEPTPTEDTTVEIPPSEVEVPELILPEDVTIIVNDEDSETAVDGL